MNTGKPRGPIAGSAGGAAAVPGVAMTPTKVTKMSADVGFAAPYPALPSPTNG